MTGVRFDDLEQSVDSESAFGLLRAELRRTVEALEQSELRFQTYWRTLAFVDLARRKKAWGVPARRGFAEAPTPRALNVRPPILARAPHIEPATATPEEIIAPPAGRWRLWELERLASLPGDDGQARLDRAAILVELRPWAGIDGTIPHQFDEVVRESFGAQLAVRDAG